MRESRPIPQFPAQRIRSGLMLDTVFFVVLENFRMTMAL
jgi:hypothetical protein